MRRIIFGLALAAAVGGASRAGAQAPPERERARAALPADVFEQVDRVANGAAQSGLPVEPLWKKALEGAAKHVPPDRILPAVSDYAARLTAAQGVLGADRAADVLVAGADALRRGVPANAIAQVGRDDPRAAVALLALADLVETGVPADRAVQVVREAIARRSADEELLALGARVRAAMRQGEDAAAAAERLRRAVRDRQPARNPVPASPGSGTRDATGTTPRPRGG